MQIWTSQQFEQEFQQWCNSKHPSSNQNRKQTRKKRAYNCQTKPNKHTITTFWIHILCTDTIHSECPTQSTKTHACKQNRNSTINLEKCKYKQIENVRYRKSRDNDVLNATTWMPNRAQFSTTFTLPNCNFHSIKQINCILEHFYIFDPQWHAYMYNTLYNVHVCVYHPPLCHTVVIVRC